MSLWRSKEKNKIWKKSNQRVYSRISRADKQEKKGRFSRLLFWILFAGFSGVCGFLLFFSPQLEINNFTVEGNKDISREEIIAKIDTVMRQNYLHLFSKKNFFFANKKEIAEILKKSFSRLEVTRVEKKFPNTMLIGVKERQPELIWCSGGVCYLIDKEGLAYSVVGDVDEEEKNNFIRIVDDNSRPVDMGITKIDKNIIDFLKKIDSLLADNFRFRLAGDYHTPALASREIIARISQENSEGWILKLDSNIAPDEIARIIQTIMDRELSGDKLKELEYMDLSVKGKVYYKLRQPN